MIKVLQLAGLACFFSSCNKQNVEKGTQVIKLETEATDGALDWTSPLDQVDQWKIYPEYADVEFGEV